MATIPVTFRVSAMPTYSMNPQVFAEQLVARLSLESQSDIAIFTTGSVLPTSDVGPFLLDGETWYIWDTGTGAYIPQPLNSLSLKYIAALAEPDETKYTFWIELDGDGNAVSINYYNDGAWHDVYEGKLGPIADAINDRHADRLDGFGGGTTGSVFAGPATQDLPIWVGVSVTGLPWIAPVDGLYQITARAQFDVTAGTPTGNTITLKLTKGGIAMSTEQVVVPGVTIPTITIPLVTQIPLLAGDELKLSSTITITGGSGTWSAGGSANTFLAGYLIQADDPVVV